MLSMKTILATGASRGIGLEWTRQCLERGHHLIATCREPEGAAELNALRNKHPEQLEVLPLDVEDETSAQNLFLKLDQREQAIDLLFNNAGIAFGPTLEKAPDRQFEDHVSVHLFGCVYGMRSAIPIMRAQGSGRIINTISRNAEVDVPGTSAYSAAKAAIWAASRVAARETSDADILINMLIPGPTNTQIWGKDRPELQAPETTFPTAKMLATLPSGGPTGKVFWDKKEYRLFDPNNNIQKAR